MPGRSGQTPHGSAVTPEVAGSSPVAPAPRKASCQAAHRALLPVAGDHRHLTSLWNQRIRRRGASEDHNRAGQLHHSDYDTEPEPAVLSVPLPQLLLSLQIAAVAATLNSKGASEFALLTPVKAHPVLIITPILPEHEEVLALRLRRFEKLASDAQRQHVREGSDSGLFHLRPDRFPGLPVENAAIVSSLLRLARSLPRPTGRERGHCQLIAALAGGSARPPGVARRPRRGRVAGPPRAGRARPPLKTRHDGPRARGGVCSAGAAQTLSRGLQSQ